MNEAFYGPKVPKKGIMTPKNIMTPKFANLRSFAHEIVPKRIDRVTGITATEPATSHTSGASHGHART